MQARVILASLDSFRSVTHSSHCIRQHGEDDHAHVIMFRSLLRLPQRNN